MLPENIAFQNKDVLLCGSLTKPESAGPFAVVIVAHTSAAGTRRYGVYEHLVTILAAAGVAAFVYDRRGSGESMGDLEAATFHDLASDMQAAIDVLKVRNDINPQQIGLWGMSQGGWIAPLAASKSTDVAFVMAVSAAGTLPAEQMNYSAEFALREEGFSESAIHQMLAFRALVYDYYRGTASRQNVQQELNELRDEAWFSSAYLDDSLPEDLSDDNWRHIMDFDPVPVMQSLDMPVLLLYGERDPWVPIAESVAIWQAYGPRETTVYQIKDANHFMVSITGAGLAADEGPMVADYASRLIHWLRWQLD